MISRGEASLTSSLALFAADALKELRTPHIRANRASALMLVGPAKPMLTGALMPSARNDFTQATIRSGSKQN